MEYQIRIKPKAEKKLNNLLPKERYKVIGVIASLAKNHFVGKKLEGEYSGYYSVRSWPYRIIYQILKNELMVLVIHIGHRQGVYK